MKITKKLPVKNVINFHPELKDDVDNVLERKSLTSSFDTLDDISQYEATGIISTTSVDADGDIVDSIGLDTTIYNGVVIFNHDLGELPIGQVIDIKSTEDSILAKFKFSETYDFAKDCFNLIKENILRGISVGYIPLEILKKGTQAFNDYAAKRGFNINGVNRIIKKWQLIEVSVVPVGCNHDALILAAKNFTSELTYKNFKLDIDDKPILSDELVAYDDPILDDEPVSYKTVENDIKESEKIDEQGKLDQSDNIDVNEHIELEKQEEVKPEPKIIILRRGGLEITDDIKNKAKLFLAGKSF